MATGTFKMSDNDDIDAIQSKRKVPTLVLKVNENPSVIPSNELENKYLLCLLGNGMGRNIWCKISKNALKFAHIFQKDAVIRIKNAVARQGNGPEVENVSSTYLLFQDTTEITLMKKEGNSSYIVAPCDVIRTTEIFETLIQFLKSRGEETNATANKNSSSALSSEQTCPEMPTTSSTTDEHETTVSPTNNNGDKSLVETLKQSTAGAIEDDNDNSFAKKFSDGLLKLNPEKRKKCENVCLDILSNFIDD